MEKISFIGLHIVSLAKDKHILMRDSRPISEHETHAAAWKAFDRMSGEPVNKSEDRSDYHINKILTQ